MIFSKICHWGCAQIKLFVAILIDLGCMVILWFFSFFSLFRQKNGFATIAKTKLFVDYLIDLGVTCRFGVWLMIFLDFHEKTMPAASLFKKATNSLFWRHVKWVKKLFFSLFWTKKRFGHRCSNEAICCFFDGFWSSSADFMNFSWNLIKIMKNSLSRGTAHRRQGSTLYLLPSTPFKPSTP